MVPEKDIVEQNKERNEEYDGNAIKDRSEPTMDVAVEVIQINKENARQCKKEHTNVSNDEGKIISKKG